jgi:hypothetical protein
MWGLLLAPATPLVPISILLVTIGAFLGFVVEQASAVLSDVLVSILLCIAIKVRTGCVCLGCACQCVREGDRERVCVYGCGCLLM